MNIRTFPLVPFAALAVAAVPALAGAARPSRTPSSPVRVEVVDDAALHSLRGRYFGADMLVGVRIDLLSHWQTAQGALQAGGSLQLQRQADGSVRVQVDTRSHAGAEHALGSLAANGDASGGDRLHVQGITQVNQIAGDGNRFANTAGIGFVTAANAAAGQFNGQAASASGSGDLQAVVRFTGSGMQLQLQGPGGALEQRVGVLDGQAGITQSARIAGNGQAGGNAMQVQFLTQAMPDAQLRQLGVSQALAAMAQMKR